MKSLRLLDEPNNQEEETKQATSLRLVLAPPVSLDFSISVN